MTTPLRFEQDLPVLLDDLYVTGMPDYRDDLVRRIAATRQRPAWTFPERWLPMEFTTRAVPAAGMPWRQLGVLALIAVLLAVALAAYVGSQPRLPEPFGVASNGSIVYAGASEVRANGGDIFMRDAPDAPLRMLIGGPTDDHDPWFTRDGSRLLFVRTIDGVDHLMAAGADGSAIIEILDVPLRAESAEISPDGATVAVINTERGSPQIRLAKTDGTSSSVLPTEDFTPLSATWQPPDGRRLLVRGRLAGGTYDLFLVDPEGSPPVALGAVAPRQFAGGSWDAMGAVWSPNGDAIAYNVPEFDTRNDTIAFRLHLMAADGSDERPAAPPVDPAVQESWPSYSPDGRLILVHRWTWSNLPDAAGWLAVLPADGRTPGRDIGPRIPGGDRTGLVQAWSPDGSQVLVKSDNTNQVFRVDVADGSYEELEWGALTLPDWQRTAP